MQLILTSKEVEKALYESLCNGLNCLQGSGLYLECKDADYDKAKAELTKFGTRTSPCFEDVLMQMLKMKLPLWFEDKVGNEKNAYLTLTKAKKHFKNPKAMKVLIDTLSPNGNSDAITAYNLLQYALFNELLYA